MKGQAGNWEKAYYKKCFVRRWINFKINIAYRLPDYNRGIMVAIQPILLPFVRWGREYFFCKFVDIPVETPNLGVSTIMQLSEIGKFAEKFLIEIPKHFPFIELGNFEVTPNHVHCILIINKNTDTMGNEKWKLGTVWVVINQYKRIVTINARKIHPDFGWQTRFYDHIFKMPNKFERIQNYIVNNPINWCTDKLYINNT